MAFRLSSISTRLKRALVGSDLTRSWVKPVRPVLTFQPDVADWVRAHYQKAETILEYGSGGSTVLAAEMPGKLVFSVESDPIWTRMLEDYLAGIETRSTIRLHPVDIGPVRKWGKPKTDAMAKNYHKYPFSVWRREDFRHPDLVLIDGRFRPACMLAVGALARKPTTVLWDDYAERPQYHLFEDMFPVAEMRGEMARFEVEPGKLSARRLAESTDLLVQSR